MTKYAKHAGISVRGAADQLKRVGVDYFEPFDFALADRLREAARHADRVPLSEPTYGRPDSVSSPELPDDQILGQGPYGITGPAIKSFAEAQARERHFKAKLAELEYEERAGKLVEVEKVEAEAFRIGQQVRDAILNVPSRLSGIVAAESDQRKVHDLLERELRQALEALAVDDSVRV